jgi:hypothetical protein
MSADTPLDRPIRRTPWEWIVGMGVVGVLFILCVPAILASREEARRQASINNLKQIGLALHNYRDVYGRFPPGGTFGEDGVGLHGWPTLIVPFLFASPFYDRIDTTIPWDDPKQIDEFMQMQIYCYFDPGNSQKLTIEGVPLIHYAANERLMNQGEGVSLEDIPNPQSTLLVADAFGEFRPWGEPFNWRDPTVPFRTSPRQFGGSAREVTLAAFVDGSVNSLWPDIDAEVFARLAGPQKLRPAAELVERPMEPYQLKTSEYWRRLRAGQGGHMMKGGFRVDFTLSPDCHFLEADFSRLPSLNKDASRSWPAEFKTFVKSKPIEHVQVSGALNASELALLLQIPTLKRLTLSTAQIEGDKDAVLRKLPSTIEVD